MQREISSEKLPPNPNDDGDLDSLQGDVREPIKLPTGGYNLKGMTEEEISERIETILLERIKDGNNLALFQLGQLYFEQEEYEDSVKYFEKAADKGDFQAMFQLGIILYDGLGDIQDCKRAFECMMQVATSTNKQAQHLVRAAQFNVGRGYFQGFGVRQSDELAEKFWLLAADDGNPKASIKAQTTLGLFYSLPDTLNLKKAFFWHSEACGNGSLESQGALGVMYQNGMGCRRSDENSFVCTREAAERGNVYAMGHLVSYYYKRKLYTKAVELAARVSQLDNIEQIAEETDCLAGFIRKGIALSCFYYGRLLHQGVGIKRDEDLAQQYYSKCYQYDPDMCAQLQGKTQHGAI